MLTMQPYSGKRPTRRVNIFKKHHELHAQYPHISNEWHLDSRFHDLKMAQHQARVLRDELGAKTRITTIDPQEQST